MEFQEFPKIPRWKRGLIITEKVDGTNACIAFREVTRDEGITIAKENNPYALYLVRPSDPTDLIMFVGSRSRWICPEGSIPGQKGTDNFAFARWARDNFQELSKLGPGTHYGEWFGKGIQRGYGLDERRFALFNVSRWGAHNPNTPACCTVVPQLNFEYSDDALSYLVNNGSLIAPGFMKPEGVIVYHTASRSYFKQTVRNDAEGKWAA